MSPSRQHTYACPVQLTIDIVGGKWKPLILWLLRGGRPRRFNDLQRAMPDVPSRMRAPCSSRSISSVESGSR